jgi:hypothetical protein
MSLLSRFLSRAAFPARTPHTTPARLRLSGNAALGTAALVQAAIGTEFLLAGLNNAVNASYVDQFRGFVQGSPGATSGPLASAIQTLVVPYVELMARVAMWTELGAGAILLVSAVEVARRRLSGPLGAPHAYEPVVALISAACAFVLGALSLTIYALQGGRVPTINPGDAFASPIAAELLLVPLALAIALMELARYMALRTTPPTPALH